MKTLKIMNAIVLLSILLSSACGKDVDSCPSIDDQQLIGIWLSNEYIPSFLFGYEQGFELLEDGFYNTIETPFPAAPIDTTYTIIGGVVGKWFLNEKQDFIIFTSELSNDSISYRIEALSNDSLILFGKSLADTENKDHVFIKKKVTTLSAIQNRDTQKVTIKGNLVVSANQEDKIMVVSIYDLSGRLVQTKNRIFSSEYELNPVKPGTYVVSVTLSNNEVVNLKYYH